MKQMYANLLQLDRPFYEVHEDGYDPLLSIVRFWDGYPLAAIREYLIALNRALADGGTAVHTKNETINHAIFCADVLRVLIAYFLTHSRNIDVRTINLSKLEANDQEIKLTKKIHDFFQRINHSNTYDDETSKKNF